MRLHEIATIILIVGVVACAVVEITGLGTCLPDIPAPIAPKET